MAISPKHTKADPKGFYLAEDQDQLIERYDDAATVYDAAMESDVGWRGHLALADVVARLVDPTATLCDAGAGTGMLGDQLAERGFTTMDANDLSEGMLEIAKTKGIYRDCQLMELGKSLAYASNTYDAVTVCGVFTPNHAPASSLDELVRITKPGGLILYTLRADEEPPEFAGKHLELEQAGSWRLVEAGEPFPSIGSEPHIRHRCWVWRVS
ncbi:MAG: methyltransferase domain-containing protein [Pseudomonadota bacterium]